MDSLTTKSYSEKHYKNLSTFGSSSLTEFRSLGNFDTNTTLWTNQLILAPPNRVPLWETFYQIIFDIESDPKNGRNHLVGLFEFPSLGHVGQVRVWCWRFSKSSNIFWIYFSQHVSNLSPIQKMFQHNTQHFSTSRSSQLKVPLWETFYQIIFDTESNPI